MTSTRRGFLQRAGVAALGVSGIYGLAEGMGPKPARAYALAPYARAPEQHLFGKGRLVRDNGIEVLVPPLHHQVITANLRVAPTRSALRAAKAELEAALLDVERRYAPPPAGL